MLCINSYPYGDKHCNPWKLSHSCSHDISPSTVTFWQGLWQVTSVPILGFLLQAAAPMVGHTKTSPAAWSRTDRLRPKQGSEMGLLNRKQTNKPKPKDSEPRILSLFSCCCLEPGCNRGTKSPNEMPRNSQAQCPQQVFALSGGDEFSACKYFLIHPILNLKLTLDHSVLEKYPHLIKSHFWGVICLPQEKLGLSAPQIYALAHLPSTALGRGQPSTTVRKCPPCSGSLPGSAKTILLFQTRKNPHTHTMQNRHTLTLSFPQYLIKNPGLL